MSLFLIELEASMLGKALEAWQTRSQGRDVFGASREWIGWNQDYGGHEQKGIHIIKTGVLKFNTYIATSSSYVEGRRGSNDGV